MKFETMNRFYLIGGGRTLFGFAKVLIDRNHEVPVFTSKRHSKELGEIIKSKEYFSPESAKMPQDYFDAAAVHEISFLIAFVNELERGRTFRLNAVPEHFSNYFPMLNTIKNGWIDWSWNTEDIAGFVNTIDDS